MIRFLAVAMLAGCGVTSAALRLSHLPFGEHVPDEETALHLDTAPASHAIVDWPSSSIRCGRITDIHVVSTTYTFTPVMKIMMLFLGGLGEGFGGTMVVALAHGNRDNYIGGGIMLADAALAVAGALLWDRRAETEQFDRYGLAYQCNPGDGIALGDHVAPVTQQGELAAQDLAALREEIKDGKALRLVVDRKVVGVPVAPAERCSMLPSDQRDASCAELPAAAPVLVTLTRVPSVVRLPMLPPPPAPPAPPGAVK